MIPLTLLDALIQILSFLLNIYIWVIVIHSLILFINPYINHPIIILFNRLIMPLYAKIKRFIPTIYNNIDFTPLLAIIAFKFVDLFILRLISDYLRN